jgi:hypothetical protein
MSGMNGMSIPFNWRQYLINYPDLVMAGIKNENSALTHYLKYGKNEFRTDNITTSIGSIGSIGSINKRIYLLSDNQRTVFNYLR